MSSNKRLSTTANFGIRLRKTGLKEKLVSNQKNELDKLNEQFPITKMDRNNHEEDGGYSLNILTNQKKFQLVLDIPFSDVEKIISLDKSEKDMQYKLKLYGTNTENYSFKLSKRHIEKFNDTLRINGLLDLLSNEDDEDDDIKDITNNEDDFIDDLKNDQKKKKE